MDSVIDYFCDNGAGPVPLDWAGFEGRFLSARGADEIVVTPGRIVAIKPDSWRPFVSLEELRYLDPSRLVISRARDSDYAEGECVRFDFGAGGLVVTYAGKTMWPERSYYHPTTEGNLS